MIFSKHRSISLSSQNKQTNSAVLMVYPARIYRCNCVSVMCRYICLFGVCSCIVYPVRAAVPVRAVCAAMPACLVCAAGTVSPVCTPFHILHTHTSCSDTVLSSHPISFSLPRFFALSSQFLHLHLSLSLSLSLSPSLPVSLSHSHLKCSASPSG